MTGLNSFKKRDAWSLVQVNSHAAYAIETIIANVSPAVLRSIDDSDGGDDDDDDDDSGGGSSSDVDSFGKYVYHYGDKDDQRKMRDKYVYKVCEYLKRWFYILYYEKLS